MDKFAIVCAISAYANAQSGSGSQPPQTFSIARKIKNAGFDILSAYLTEGNDFSNVMQHGCWCAKLNPYIDHDILGGPSPVDDLDLICKQWIAACNCMNNAVNGSCEGRTDDDYLDFELNFDTYEGDCNNPANNNDSCLFDTCVVHTYYARQVREYVIDAANNFTNATIASPGTCQVGFGTHVMKECIGETPFFQFKVVSASQQFQLLQQTCRESGGLDVVFVVDGSGSVGQSNFDTQIEFLKQVTAAMNIGSGANDTRVAFMQYSSFVQQEFLFLEDSGSLMNALDAVIYMGGGTSTGFAITETYNQIIQPHARTGAGVAMIVVTDGASGDDVTAPSNAMRANGITMAAVGYAGANIAELNAIANDPDSDFVFMGTTSADILEMAAKLTSVICTTESSNRGIFRTLDIQMEGGFRGLGDDGFLEEELF